MNDNMNTIIGITIMENRANIHPAAPIAAPVGSVILVALVALATALAITGVAVLIIENMGVNANAKYNPTIKAIIADIQAIIRDRGTIGIDFTSLASNPSLIPPTLGASRLYNKARKKLIMMLRKNEVKGARIITAIPISAKIPPNVFSWGIKAATSPKAMTNIIAAINAKIASIEAFIKVKGAALICFISLTSTIFFQLLYVFYLFYFI
jgi:hypothetical protein